MGSNPIKESPNKSCRGHSRKPTPQKKKKALYYKGSHPWKLPYMSLKIEFDHPPKKNGSLPLNDTPKFHPEFHSHYGSIGTIGIFTYILFVDFCGFHVGKYTFSSQWIRTGSHWLERWRWTVDSSQPRLDSPPGVFVGTKKHLGRKGQLGVEALIEAQKPQRWMNRRLQSFSPLVGEKGEVPTKPLDS